MFLLQAEGTVPGKGEVLKRVSRGDLLLKKSLIMSLVVRVWNDQHVGLAASANLIKVS